MKVRRLQIEQQMAQIHIDSKMASLSVKMPKRTMAVEQGRAQMSIKREAPKIKLDMESFRNNIGLKSVYTITEESAASAQAQAEQSTKEFAADANYIGTLPSSGNPIGQLAKSKMLADKTPEMNTGKVPDGAIKMEGTSGQIKIDWSKQDLKINWGKFQGPIITVEPKASVDVHIDQEPVIEYTVVEQTIPAETGRAINAEA